MLDFDSIVRKKLSAPDYVHFRASAIFAHEITVEATCIDSSGFSHFLGNVTNWFILPKHCGQGQCNAIIKRMLKPSALDFILIEIADLESRGFNVRLGDRS